MTINHRLYKVKVGDPTGPGWNHAFDQLSVLLEERLLRGVRPGTPHELLAFEEAAIALDWSRSCRMIFYSHGFRRFLLTQALRQGVRGAPIDNPPAPAGLMGTPEQWAAQVQWDDTLRDLIQLSRRVWVYHRLRETRQCVTGWIGVLAHAIGISAPAMATERTRLHTSLEQLHRAWGTLVEKGPQGDSVLGFLEQLQSLTPPSNAESFCGGRAAFATSVLDAMQAARPLVNYTSIQYPALARTLNHLVDLYQQNLPLALAAEELCLESRQPSSVLPAAPWIRQLLRALPADHGNESAPDQVVDWLAGLPLVPPPIVPGPSPDRRPREHLVPVQLAMLQPGSPERTVVTRLCLCDGLDAAREALQHALPALAGLPQDWIHEGLVVLARWHDRLGYAAEVPLTLAESWEIPEPLNTDLPAALQDIQHAMDVFSGVLQGAPVAAWNMLQPRVELACRAALFVVILNSLVQDLGLVYRAWRHLPAGGPMLPAFLLGPGWQDPAIWPNPAVVRQQVQDLAAHAPPPP